MRSFASKLRSYTIRFALILHLLHRVADQQRPRKINQEDILRACELAWYVARHYYAVLELLGQKPTDVQALLNWMERKNLQECSLREVQRAEVASLTSSAAVLKLFETAESQGYGKVELIDQSTMFKLT